MSFGPSNQETDKSRGDTAKDSLNNNTFRKQQKNPSSRVKHINELIPNSQIVHGYVRKAPKIKKVGKVRKKKYMGYSLTTRGKLKETYQTEHNNSAIKKLYSKNPIRRVRFALGNEKNNIYHHIKISTDILDKLHQNHRHGLRNSLMSQKVEAYDWTFRNKDKCNILQHHPKFGSAKFSKPKFQRLFQATQKRTTAESQKLSSKHKKPIARKTSSQEIMFRKVHNLNKNMPSVATQRDVIKESRKFDFNYPPLAAAICRDGRFIQSRKIWVQGIPMDIAQINGLIEVLRNDYELPVTDESKEELCSLVAAALVVPTWVKGSKPLDIIGSTTAVGAFIFELEEITSSWLFPTRSQIRLCWSSLHRPP
jgi:hypothetical protein